jgi:hypothetical protein
MEAMPNDAGLNYMTMQSEGCRQTIQLSICRRKERIRRDDEGLRVCDIERIIFGGRG